MSTNVANVFLESENKYVNFDDFTEDALVKYGA